MTAVVPQSTAKPIMDRILARFANPEEELNDLGVNLIDMQDSEGEGDQVSGMDPLAVPISTDHADSLFESILSDSSSFVGFNDNRNITNEQEPAPQQEKKAAFSSHKEKKNQPSSNKHYPKDPRSYKNTKKSKSKSKNESNTSAGASQQKSHSPSPQSQTGDHAAPAPAPDPRALPQLDMPALLSAIMQSLKPTLDHLETKIQNLGHSDESLMPSIDSLPPYDESNPWRSALRAPCQNNMLTIEGLGTRPVSDFEFFPTDGQLPYVYVCLSESASVREDKVPKETVLYPREKAQNVLMQSLKSRNCNNTRLLPFKGGLTMFTTPKEMPNPFSTKVLEAVTQATLEDKPSPVLREEEFTSLLFPADSEGWSDVALTFSVGKLSADCCSLQFNEDLPKIPEGMISKEFEARSRLARSLHSFTLAEYIMSCDPNNEILKVLVKSMVCSLRHDLFDFAQIRRNCRKHVLQNAEVRHEPTRLINGSIWGVNLFPADLAREAVNNAARLNLSLKNRWGIQEKRKFHEGLGPQPKNKRIKRGTLRTPRLLHQHHQMFPIARSASGPQAQGTSNQHFVLVPNPQQSPAFNPVYEGQGLSFRAAGFVPHRGDRGRGGRGRGQYHQQPRGRGGSHRGNLARGSSAKGRGARGAHSQ